jgi:formamidopyrimidine-DNA glycosylase
MPELPETETIARDLDAEVSGATIVATEVPRADVLRECTPRDLATSIAGMRIERVWRRAKCIVLDLALDGTGTARARKGHPETDVHIVVQPRFTGGLFIDNGDAPESELTYAAVSFHLDDGRWLHYRDVRRLGTVSLMSRQRFDAYSDALGAEPLDPSFEAGHLSALLRSSRQAVKIVLMDQRKVAGVGNIYANEALWRAGIDPSRAAHTITDSEAALLLDELRAVLQASIAARGTSFRDYRDARGERGGFVAQLDAYGREGAPCHRCGRKLIGTHAIDGRSTVFCASCQR